MSMEIGRKVSVLIPYKVEDGEILVFLQKRSDRASRLPGYFGFFGGGIENGETPEEALKREIKEEMNFAPENYEFLVEDDFELNKKLHAICAFILRVGDNFERNIVISEGDYGVWFKLEEALKEKKIIDHDKVVLRNLSDKLLK